MGAPCGNHNHLKHGGTGTRLYTIWKSMRQRCYNPKNQKFKQYGARGILICNDWSDFVAFREWATQHGYGDDLSIDRIDVNKGYSPSNCRWVDSLVQANNKTSNKIIHYDGEAYTMAEFCRKERLNYKRFAKRIKEGVSVDRSLRGDID